MLTSGAGTPPNAIAESGIIMSITLIIGANMFVVAFFKRRRAESRRSLNKVNKQDSHEMTLRINTTYT